MLGEYCPYADVLIELRFACFLLNLRKKYLTALRRPFFVCHTSTNVQKL